MKISPQSLPTMKDVKYLMRANSTRPIYYKVLKAYVIGSYARGMATKESDLDIALVIPPKEVSALKLSERYHACFEFDEYKPHYEIRCGKEYRNITVDFQFFYPNSKVLDSYDKIPITK
jgi:predicted nucleotidyltransferase